MFKLLAIIILMTSTASMASVKYEIVHSEIKPFVSNSFGSGYMGLSGSQKEPGYGLFFDVKIFSGSEQEISEFLSDNSFTKSVCNSIAVKSLLNDLYTVNVSYLDPSDRVILNTMINKNSCIK